MNYYNTTGTPGGTPAPSCTSVQGSCPCYYSGCTDPTKLNYNAQATCDDGSCGAVIVTGCTDPSSFNYNPSANQDDGSCTAVVTGCMDQAAANYNSNANTPCSTGGAQAFDGQDEYANMGGTDWQQEGYQGTEWQEEGYNNLQGTEWQEDGYEGTRWQDGPYANAAGRDMPDRRDVENTVPWEKGFFWRTPPTADTAGVVATRPQDVQNTRPHGFNEYRSFNEEGFGGWNDKRHNADFIADRNQEPYIETTEHLGYDGYTPSDMRNAAPPEYPEGWIQPRTAQTAGINQMDAYDRYNRDLRQGDFVNARPWDPVFTG